MNLKPQFQQSQPQPHQQQHHQPSQQSPQQQSPQSNNRNLPIDTAKLIDSTLQNINSSHLRNNFNEKRLLVKLLKATNLSSNFIFKPKIYVNSLY
jgi:hypothetical protein